MNSLTKVNMIIGEYTRLWTEIQNENYVAVNEKINSTTNGLNLLRNDLGVGGERNIATHREEYELFMTSVLEDESLGDQDMITRYSRKIQENLLGIKAQLKQRPHNLPKVDRLSIGIIILLGDIEVRWYR